RHSVRNFSFRLPRRCGARRPRGLLGERPRATQLRWRTPPPPCENAKNDKCSLGPGKTQASGKIFLPDAFLISHYPPTTPRQEKDRPDALLSPHGSTWPRSGLPPPPRYVSAPHAAGDGSA